MSQDGPPREPYPAPPTPYPYTPQPVLHTGNGWYRLASVLRLALLLNVLVYAVDLTGSWWAVRRLSSWLEDPTTITIQDAQRIDTLNQTMSVVELLLEVVTAVLFICWLYQSYGRPLAERSALRMRRGWAIGGWFIPIAGYWIPYRVVQGVHCATASPPRPESRLVIGWWASYVTFSILGALSVAAAPHTTLHHGRRLIRDIRIFDTWAAVSAAPGVVAAILATVVVARITAQVRAAVPIPAHRSGVPEISN